MSDEDDFFAAVSGQSKTDVERCQACSEYPSITKNSRCSEPSRFEFVQVEFCETHLRKLRQIWLTNNWEWPSSQVKRVKGETDVVDDNAGTGGSDGQTDSIFETE